MAKPGEFGSRKSEREVLASFDALLEHERTVERFIADQRVANEQEDRARIEHRQAQTAAENQRLRATVHDVENRKDGQIGRLQDTLAFEREAARIPAVVCLFYFLFGAILAFTVTAAVYIT